MKDYKVTVCNETPYGAFIPETRTFKALNIEMLYKNLKQNGYKRYFIGSLSEDHIDQ